MRQFRFNSTACITLGLVGALMAAGVAQGQGRFGAPAGAPRSAEASAPVNLTGYWESVVTQDWLWRMVTPRPGDYENVPLKASGIEVMDAWNPAHDTAMGEQCKSYGAPAIMRVPEILHISWQDPQTLKIQTDAGEQTRLFHFLPPGAMPKMPAMPPSWQGYSVAQWQLQYGERVGGNFFARGKAEWGNLKVSTTDLKAGYLRKNGIPYSAHTKVLEYFDLVPQVHGKPLLVVTSVVTDPTYLYKPFVTTDNFKQLPNGAKWSPTACSAMW